MIKDFFDEIFGENFCNEFGKAFKEAVEELKDETNVSKEEDDKSCYYHKIMDEYKDGHHVCHKEKEIKDGKTLKDVDEHYKIEDANQEKAIEVEDKSNSNNNIGYYNEKLKEANNMLEEAQDTIKRQQEEYERLEKEFKKYIIENEFYKSEYKKLNNKFSTLKEMLK